MADKDVLVGGRDTARNHFRHLAFPNDRVARDVHQRSSHRIANQNLSLIGYPDVVGHQGRRPLDPKNIHIRPSHTDNGRTAIVIVCDNVQRIVSKKDGIEVSAAAVLLTFSIPANLVDPVVSIEPVIGTEDRQTVATRIGRNHAVLAQRIWCAWESDSGPRRSPQETHPRSLSMYDSIDTRLELSTPLCPKHKCWPSSNQEIP